ncbi:unnamed protein product [Caenorhabditis angaria]|uniref:Apple domain-containing protein n=1 Tax=Caenorhabditis angaria TaxID=860376 RepID=A0A9P1IGS1_9PELO|nr:unnamed protein product [Caenorhabditis angaria]
MHLLFSVFFLSLEVHTAFVSIPGIINYSAEPHDQTTLTNESCKGICVKYLACQAYYYNTVTTRCFTYDFSYLQSFIQLDTYPATDIFTFKADITTCSEVMPSVFYSYSTFKEQTYKYTKNGTIWTTQVVT